MKKISFILSSAVIIFISCKKSATEAATPTGYQWPAGTSEYAPYTNGSTFTFETSTGTPVVVDSFTYTVTKDTAISGKTFRKLQSNKPSLAATYFTNFSDNVITEISYNNSFQGVAIPPILQTVLLDNVAVNTVWKDSTTVTVPYNGFNIPIPVSFNYTMLQKDITKNILSKDYVNTFEVKQIISIPQQYSTAANLPTNSVQLNNFYSKGVGRIQRDAQASSIKIKRYNVVK